MAHYTHYILLLSGVLLVSCTSPLDVNAPGTEDVLSIIEDETSREPVIVDATIDRIVIHEGAPSQYRMEYPSNYTAKLQLEPGPETLSLDVEADIIWNSPPERIGHFGHSFRLAFKGQEIRDAGSVDLIQHSIKEEGIGAAFVFERYKQGVPPEDPYRIETGTEITPFRFELCNVRFESGSGANTNELIVVLSAIIAIPNQQRLSFQAEIYLSWTDPNQNTGTGS